LTNNEKHLSTKRIEIVNNICKDNNLKVVISSTWRIGKTLEWLQEILNSRGATFKIIGKTGYSNSRIRGVEIYEWLKENINLENYGCYSYNFNNFVILDDDSDILLNQKDNFFQVDNYTGITPTHEYKIKRFLDKLK
jgi:hypothetical protein